jgi:serine/threonine-protein kinase
VGIAAVRARGALRQELEFARAVTPSDPVRALGLLQSIEARAPTLAGLAEARDAAVQRRDALALEGRRAQAATLLANGQAAAERHAALHAEWLRLEAEDDAALARELAGAPADHDPGQAQRRARMAELSPERDAAYAAALSALGGAEQVLASDPGVPERVAAATVAAGCAWARLQAAEARFDRDGAARFARDLAAHGAATHAAQVEGHGTLTLATVPSGARVRAGRYHEREGVLVAEPDQDLGTTPLAAVPLAMGSWLLVIERDGCVPVRYPLLVMRQEAHALPAPLRLLRPAQVGDGFVYVPGGFTVLGNDGKARTAWPPHRKWVDGFLIGRDEITVAEYAAWLQDVLAHGATTDEVLARAPRQNPRDGFYWMVEGGRLRSRLPEGPNFPVGGISWNDAMAYAEWRSGRDGRRYRLATNDEWQRAGRGADGRRYPWGTVFDWRRCVGGRWPGHGEQPWAAPAGSAPDDMSPFGVRDLCGNLEEWIGDGWNGGQSRGRRGGCWGLGGLIDFHLANHGTASAMDVNLSRGFRLACDLPRE